MSHHRDHRVRRDVDGASVPPAHRRLRHGPHSHGGPVQFGPGRRRRSKRGDVRAAVLLLLEEQPRNGYQLIQEIEERSHSAWRPSPGSIYPVLNQLEDEGLITGTSGDGGRTFTLTPAGTAAVAQQRDALGQPWDSAAAEVGEGRFDLMRTTRQLWVAARQVMESGSDAQVKKATDIMKESRRRLYAVLSEEDPDS